MGTYKLIIRNAFSNWMSTLVTSFIGFFLMPFLVHRLGDALYGIWVLIIALTGYGVLLDFGVRSSIIKYTSQYNATSDRTRLNSIFNTSLIFYSATGLVLILVASFFVPFLPRFFNIPSQFVHDARVAFMVVMVNLALKFPCGVFEGFLCGIQRYDVTNGVTIFTAALKAIAILIFLKSGYGLITLSLIMMTTDIAADCLMLLFCLRHFPYLTLSLQVIDKEMFKSIYQFGVYSFIIIIASKLMYESDAIIIGASLSAQVITLYAVANNLTRYLRQIAYGFGNVFNPVASELDAKQESDKIEGLLISGTKYSLVVILPIAAALVILGEEFISLWMGSRYAELTSRVVAILTISQVVAMAQFSSGSILYGLNKHKYLAFVLLLESFVKLLLSLALIGPYGIIGLAIATAIPEVIVYLVVLPRYISKTTGLCLLRYFREGFFPPLLSVVPFACFIYFCKVTLGPFSWEGFLTTIVTGLLLYGASSLVICFNGRQRNQIGGIFARASIFRGSSAERK